MGRGLLGALLTKSCWASEVRIHQQKTKPKLGEAPLRWFLLLKEFTKKVLKLVVYRLFGLQFEDICCTENHRVQECFLALAFGLEICFKNGLVQLGYVHSYVVLNLHRHIFR